MVFCGQCGTLLAPGDTNCPRCGMVTEPEINMSTVQDVGTDDPTIASSFPSLAPGGPRLEPQRPASLPSTPEQQRLVLRSNDGMVKAQAYDVHTPRPSVHPNRPLSHPVHIPSPQSQSHPGFVQEQALQPRRRGGAAVLLIGLVVLLLILGTIAVIVLHPGGISGNPSNNGNPGNTGNPIPAQQAQALLQQYYNDINHRNYHDAYNLWGTDPQHPRQTYDQFAAGYANTQHDDITFGPITTNVDGTVQADLTIYATETTPSGTAKHVYQGTYLVGQQNGIWKILQGNFQQIS